jgi:hypothetical protein
MIELISVLHWSELITIFIITFIVIMMVTKK